MGKFALALHGGGYAGAKQPGVCDEAFKKKVPDLVQAVSAGALNGAGLLDVGPEGVKRRWQWVEKKGPSYVFNWKGAPLRIFSDSILSNAGLTELVNQLDIRKIVESPIELQIVTRNETRDELAVFSNRDPEIIKDPEIMRKAVKASCSLPGVFSPVEIGGEWYSDGYYFDLEKLAGCDTVVLVFNDEPKNDKDRHALTWYKRFFLGHSENLDELLKCQIDAFLEHHPEFDQFRVDSSINFVQKLFKKFVDAGKKLVGTSHQLVVFSPTYSIPTLTLDSFEQPGKNKEGDIAKAIRLGQEQAKKLFEQLEV